MTDLTFFYRGKKVLITGHTGFIGSWLTLWLLRMGVKITGLSLEPHTERDHFVRCHLKNEVEHHQQDIRNFEATLHTFTHSQPDIIFHLAAQPIVSLGYQEPFNTINTNVMGTLNILECCRLIQKNVTVVIVTSDKCYDNQNTVSAYREGDPLGGFDPYSASKGAAEIVSHAYRQSFFGHRNNPFKKSLSTARAGNVLGGGDWQVHRLIPDCIRFLEKKMPIGIRNPSAVRPWQHVFELVSGCLKLAERLHHEPDIFSGAWNFGPDSGEVKSVKDVVMSVIHHYGSGSWQNMDTHPPFHETNILTLDNSKAKRMLRWKPVWDFETAICETIEWYTHSSSSDIRKFSESQIEKYNALVTSNN